jgi:hypothetical protein
MQMEQVYRQNMTVKVMKIWRIFYFLIWLGFQMLMTLKSNSLKSFISAPVRLIDKRGLICDHSQLFVYFWKYLLLISITDDFRKFKTLTF